MITNSVVGQMPLRHLETLVRCLLTMWQMSKLCADGFGGFGLVISVLKINLMLGLQPRLIITVVEWDASQITCALVKRFNVSFLSVLDHLKQIGKV